MHNLCSSLNELFQGTKVVKHPYYSIGPKKMFGSVSEHFTNLQHIKRSKTWVSGLYALFRGTEVVKHPFYSIRPKMVFGSILDHFANLRHVKRSKTVLSGLNALFRGTEFVKQNMCFGPVCTISGFWSCEEPILLHQTQNDDWECFGAFRKPSAYKRCITCVQA
jgi:acid stress-induced BolA-like protein IbaG/YrbA